MGNTQTTTTKNPSAASTPPTVDTPASSSPYNFGQLNHLFDMPSRPMYSPSVASTDGATENSDETTARSNGPSDDTDCDSMITCQISKNEEDTYSLSDKTRADDKLLKKAQCFPQAQVNTQLKTGCKRAPGQSCADRIRIGEKERQVMIKVVERTTEADFEAEIHLLASQGAHTNVLQLLQKEHRNGFWLLTTETYAMSMQRFLVKTQQSPNLQVNLNLFIGTLRGLKHLHDLGISHYNITPENIVLQRNRSSTSPENRYIPKITNFRSSIAQNVNPEAVIHMRGSPQYRAPELYHEIEYLLHIFTRKSNVWSCGMLLAELAGARRLPWKEANETDDIFSEYVTLGKDDIATRKCQLRRLMPILHDKPMTTAVMSKILDPNPTTRITIKKLIAETSNPVYQKEWDVSMRNQQMKTQDNLDNGTAVFNIKKSAIKRRHQQDFYSIKNKNAL